MSNHQVKTGKELCLWCLNSPKLFFNYEWQSLKSFAELVWLLYLAMLHAHILDIKNNTFWMKCMQSIIFIEHTLCTWCPESAGWVTEEKAKAQSPYGGRPSIPASLFPGLYANNFHLHPMLVAHFLNFITYQRHPTLQILNSSITAVFLLAHLQDSDFQSKETQVFIRISCAFTGLSSCAHADTFMHKYPSPWKHSLWEFHLFASLPPPLLHTLRTIYLEEVQGFLMNPPCSLKTKWINKKEEGMLTETGFYYIMDNRIEEYKFLS